MSDASYDAAQPGTASRGGRTGLVVALVVGLVLLLLAGGAFAAWRAFSGSGARPAEVLPASTLGVVSVDLDPSGQQKIEAVRVLRKFPSFREEVGLEEDDDLVQAFFEELQDSEGACPEVDYRSEVAPWLGERFALAAVEVGEEPVPALVVQVTDRDAAQTGLPALQACGGEDTGGFALGEEYAVLSDTTQHAEAVLAAGEESPLSDDADYQRWTDEAGGDGFVELYAAPGAVDYVEEAFAGEGLADAAGGTEALAEQLDAFRGAAAVLRFDDGGVTMRAAAGTEGSYESESVGDHVAALPADTAATLAVAVPESAREALREAAESPGAGPQGDAIGYVAGLLSSVGLDFPDDVITVLGDALSVSLGGEPGSGLSPADIPLGLLVQGDSDGIEEVIGKVEAAAGGDLAQTGAIVRSDDDAVVLSTRDSYAEELLGEGSLGEAENFTDVVAEADDAQVVLFAQLQDPWREFIADQGVSAEDMADLAPLRAFGFSAWNEDGTGYAEARLALN